MSDIPFLNRSTSANEIRKIFMWIRTKITDALGTMAWQNADDVDITGGSIKGTDVDVSGATLTLADNQIDIDNIGSDETNVTKVLKPDGSGGVEFGANSGSSADGLVTDETDTSKILNPDGAGGVVWNDPSGGTVEELTTTETDDTLRLAPDGAGGVEWASGGGGDTYDAVTFSATVRMWDGTAEYNEVVDLPLSDGNGNIIYA